MPTPASSAANPAAPRDTPGLWLGCAGPPLVWFAQFELRYALAGALPETRQHAIVAAGAIVALVVLAGLMAYSWRHWRATREHSSSDNSGSLARRRFMAGLGTLLAALFFLVTAAQFLADAFISAGPK